MIRGSLQLDKPPHLKLRTLRYLVLLSGFANLSSKLAMVSTGASRRLLILFILAFAFVSVLFLGAHRQPAGQPAPIRAEKGDQDQFNGASLTGHAIAPKLGNATAK